MSIITATKKEAKILATIISESNKGVAKQFDLNFENAPKHPSFCKEDWVLRDFERGEEYFIYQKEGVSTGCVAFENPRPGVAYLNRLSILPEHQREGIGEALVHHIIEYAKKRDISRISIGIIAEHTVLKKWYEKLGFEVGETKSFEHLPFNVQYMRFTL